MSEAPLATGVRALGGAAKWWLHHSLLRLIDALDEQGIPLLILNGDPRELLPEIARRTGARTVSWTRRYHLPGREIDAEVKERLRSQGVEAHSFPGHLLAEPWTVATKQGTAYKVFTPFSRALRSIVDDGLDAGDLFLEENSSGVIGGGAEPQISRRALDALALLPTHPSRGEPDWSGGLASTWEPGEDGAWRRLEAFIDTIDGSDGSPGYDEGRDRPGLPATSGLSAHLRFGEISPQAVWARIAEEPDAGSDGAAFQRQLMWRDFAWHRLYHRPDLPTKNVRQEFNRFPWFWDPHELEQATRGGRDGRRSAASGDGRDSYADLGDWRSGTTGFALVDAGMRELWQTGHMHNRVRMVVASLLTKNLGVHWRHGEEWFWETLVDADVASNAFNWQWVAGCGDDAAPYFRIFNPETQAKRFDPDGAYVNTWLPEADRVSHPIVDLRESREFALAAYGSIGR